jgi:NRAMP (natural resistance-associated macrophage protein)-like metal ion transporter
MTQSLNTIVPAEATAHLDSAHVGDIRGALGTIRQHDHAPRTSWRARLLTLLAIMGPGLIVMVGDNDAGGVATYAQAGQNYGTSLLWTLLLLIPVLIVNQEMVVRLGLVSGVGHARLIIERFGKFWGAFSVGDLFILNFLTIVTEFIGVSLAMSYFGVSQYISVPVAAVALIAITVTGSFRRWERFMYICILANFVAIPLAIMSHPKAGPVIHDSLIPHVQGALNSTVILLIIGIVGTTVAPWQLFFQQSNVIDKRLTPRWMTYERADTAIGAVVVILGAAALMIATAFAFRGTRFAGNFADGHAVADGLARSISPVAGSLFAIVLLNAAIIGAAAVTLSTSYAFGDVFTIRHSLHRSWKDARAFYAIYGALVLAATGIVLIPRAPLGLMTLAVQALAGILLPSATVFLLLLCNDRAVLGPWVNKTWLNIVASIIVGVLVALSLILAATTLFPSVDARQLSMALGVLLMVSLLATGAVQIWRRRSCNATERVPSGWPKLDRMTWRMPPLDTLPRPVWSTTRKIGMLTLRGYLVIAALLMIVKIVQLTIGH